MQLYPRIMLVFFVACITGKTVGGPAVCKSHLLSDIWYPQRSSDLVRYMTDLDAKAAQMYPGSMNQIRAMVIPHESLAASGELAAGCWRLVKDHQHITRVIFLVAERDVPFCGVVLPICTQFKTPLGILSVDKDCLAMLGRQSAYFVTSPYIDTSCAVKKAVQRGKNSDNKRPHVMHDPFNHGSALEMQLLFCSRYLPQAHIVPLMIGTLTQEDAHIIAMHLKECVDRQTLVVVSSTLTASMETILKSPELLVTTADSVIPEKYPLMVLFSLIHKKAWGSHYALKHDVSGSIGMVWADK